MTPIQEALPTAAGIAFSILVSYDVKGSYISVVGVACTAVHAQLCLYADWQNRIQADRIRSAQLFMSISNICMQDTYSYTRTKMVSKFSLLILNL
jgi:hypothetical protein